MVPHVLHLFSKSVLRLNEQSQSITGLDFATVQSKSKEKKYAEIKGWEAKDKKTNCKKNPTLYWKSKE